LTTFKHPAFEPYLDLLAQLGGRTGLDALNGVAEKMNVRHTHNGEILRFSASSKPISAAQYEQSIAASGVVPTREDNLHDFLNALVWLRFPKLKSALNLRHCRALEEQAEERRQRGRQRDQLTLLDESGMLVVSSKPDLLELLRGKCWVELFWEARSEVARRMRFIVVGHGLLEKCLAPFPGMTAKCLLLHSAETRLEVVDELAAVAVHGTEVLQLPPLPVQGVPGWDTNEYRAYYENTEIFRMPGRTPPPAA
jgi:hypothetical protein